MNLTAIIFTIIDIIVLILVFIIIATLNKRLYKVKIKLKRLEEKNTNIININKISKMEEDIELLIEESFKHSTNKQNSFAKYSLYKYDAFDELEGKLSFSLCILDTLNNGFILTSIHQENGNFLYLKEVQKAKALEEISQEEERVLIEAKNNLKMEF